MPQIVPIKELKNTSEISNLCHTSKEPVFITKNGYGDMVIMSMEAYDSLFAQLNMYQSLAKSENQVSAGETIDAEEALNEIRDRYEL